MTERPDPTRFVLLHTSHAGNVGAAARAMKVMGFSDLVLVQPRFADVLSREETVAMASGAADILVRARIVDTLERGAGRHPPCLRHGDDAARLRPADLRAARTLRRIAGQRPARGLRLRLGALRHEQRGCVSLPRLPEHPHRCALRLAEPGAGRAADRLRMAHGPRRLRGRGTHARRAARPMHRRCRAWSSIGRTRWCNWATWTRPRRRS